MFIDFLVFITKNKLSNIFTNSTPFLSSTPLVSACIFIYLIFSAFVTLFFMVFYVFSLKVRNRLLARMAITMALSVSLPLGSPFPH